MYSLSGSSGAPARCVSAAASSSAKRAPSSAWRKPGFAPSPARVALCLYGSVGLWARTREAVIRARNDTADYVTLGPPRRAYERHVYAPNAARGPGVDVFYHLWANHSDACHNRTLRALARFAADVTSEDHACSWAWGNGFGNQWHNVRNAFARVEAAERARGRRYDVVVRLRSDVLLREPFDFGAYAAAMRSPFVVRLVEQRRGSVVAMSSIFHHHISILRSMTSTQ